MSRILKRGHVLVVDDSSALRHLIELAMEQLERPPALTTLGDSALVLPHLKKVVPDADDATPDFVLLDYQMPGRTGLEVLREIRRDAALQDLPVVLFSADPSTTLRAEAIAAGATEFQQKPTDLLELIAILDELCRRYLPLPEAPVGGLHLLGHLLTETALYASSSR